MYDRTSQANKWWADAASDVREDYGKDYFMMPMRGKFRDKYPFYPGYKCYQYYFYQYFMLHI